MEAKSHRLVQAERDLQRVQQILAHPNNLQPEEWLLLASLVGEADLVVREEQRSNAAVEVPLLREVVREFREATANFKDPSFLRASRAARRKNQELFSGPS